VKNREWWAKYGLRSNLHNKWAKSRKYLILLFLTNFRHIRSSDFCAAAQDVLQFPHAPDDKNDRWASSFISP